MFGGFGPDEWLGVLPGLDPGADVGLEGLYGAVVAAADELIGDVGEPPFDLVDPAGIGRGEMHMEPGVSSEPFADGRGFVGAVVVANQVNVEVIGDLGVDLDQEFSELDGAVSPVQAGDHCSTRGIEGGEQAGGAV